MNTYTGEIHSAEYMENMRKLFSDDDFIKKTEGFVPVDEKDMTQRQKDERRVSLKDNRSKLGKKRIEVMNGLKKKKKAKRKASKKSRKNNR